VVRVNHAVALAEAGLPQAALVALEGLREVLSDFQPFHAAYADVLAKTGQKTAARNAYDRAMALTSTASDLHFLAERARIL
jgi:RNA polymerase sigma-70 factor (ECF subfamily)